MIKFPLKITSFLLLLTIVLGGTGLVWLMTSLQEELVSQRRLFREDRVWVAGQLEREARMFRHALMLYSEGDKSVTGQEMRQTFDVLWSRIDSMDKGRLGKMYLQLEGSADALKFSRSLLRTVDPLVQQLMPGQLTQRDDILILLDSAIDQYYQIARLSSALNLKQQEQRRQNFEKTTSRALKIISVIFVSGGVLVILLALKQAALNRLTHTLEDKVAERTREVEKNNEQLRMLSVAVEQSPASIFICNNDGIIEYVNPRFEQISGYSTDEALGRTPQFLQSSSSLCNHYEEIWQRVKGGEHWQGQVCNQRPNGELYWEQMSFTPIQSNDEQVIRYLAVKEDITQRKKHEEQLLRQANFDNLTGLPNRMLAMDRLSQVLRQARRRGVSAGLMFVDLDRFKQVNDTLGHDAGDQLLCEASRRLVKCLREGDTAARLGGDEFIVILPELKNPADTHNILHRINGAFSKPFLLHEKEVFTSTSIGVALYPADGETPTALLRNADAAMYCAKSGGRNTYRFFVEEMTQQKEHRAELEHHLRNALERNELQVQFQPIVNTETGSIERAEAFLFWSSHELGEVPLSTFLPLAEESGLIVNMGNWALQEACREAEQWQRERENPIDLTVNIPPRQFLQNNFVDIITKILATTGLSPSRLILGISESLLVNDKHKARVTLERLVQKRLRISLDDFGTAYSSLGYLTEFPIDTLKISDVFLRDLTPHSNEAALAASIIALGQSLQLNLVGNGVHTAEQRAFLRTHNCQMGQGIYFSKPLSREEFRAMLKDRLQIVPAES